MARQLWERGYSFDFVSDRLLEHSLDVVDRQLQSGAGTYRALLVAGCMFMPHETLARILDLARKGATVCVVGDLPEDVSGLVNVAARRQQLRSLLPTLSSLPRAGISEARLDQGHLLVGQDIEAMLHLTGIQRESIVDHGIGVIRRRDAAGYIYFMANFGQERLDQWVSLPIQAASVLVYDPITAESGMARSKMLDDRATEVYLQLEPGETLLLRSLDRAAQVSAW